ncbi:hypothetical protein G3I78_50685, partial [Streptomyces sp. SID13726]|nr:hypothetical protein [Streptomyces sp. SID13726]
MDEKEVLTRFKNGHLDRAQVAALLTGAATGTGPVVLALPELRPEPSATAEPQAPGRRPDTEGVPGRDGQPVAAPVAVVG